MSGKATPEAIASEMTALVREAVQGARAALGDLKGAIPDVARRYGISERRVQSYWWSKVTFVSAFERETILAAHARDLAIRELRQAHALEMTRAALAAQRNHDALRPAAGMARRPGADLLRGLAEACVVPDLGRGPTQGTLPFALAFGHRRR